MKNKKPWRKVPSLSNEDLARLLSKIIIKNDCWEWQGGKTTKGYGVFWVSPSTLLAHRVSFSHFIRQPSNNFVLDHLCRNKSCINPFHLNEVSFYQNLTENSDSLAAINKIKTHCKNGHEFTHSNTKIKKNGDRECKACKKIHNDNRKFKNKDYEELKR